MKKNVSDNENRKVINETASMFRAATYRMNNEPSSEAGWKPKAWENSPTTQQFPVKQL